MTGTRHANLALFPGLLSAFVHDGGLIGSQHLYNTCFSCRWASCRRCFRACDASWRVVVKRCSSSSAALPISMTCSPTRWARRLDLARSGWTVACTGGTLPGGATPGPIPPRGCCCMRLHWLRRWLRCFYRALCSTSATARRTMACSDMPRTACPVVPTPLRCFRTRRPRWSTTSGTGRMRCRRASG